VVVAPPPVASFADFTGLWGTATEPGWSLGITHHKFATLTAAATDGLVAFWHTFDATGLDMWLELKNGHWTDALTYTGTLYRSSGTPFSLPFDPAQSVDVVAGSGTLVFTDQTHGTFSYYVGGTAGSKTITRDAAAF
jgi:hypothetical protein